MRKLLIIMAVACAMANVGALETQLDTVIPIKGVPRTVTKTNYLVIEKFGEYYRTVSSKIVYNYNGAGAVTGSQEYNASGDLINKIINTYDGAGLLTAVSCYDSDNKALWNTTLTYRDGKLIDESEYNGGSLRGRTIYTYTNNNLMDESYYNGEGAIIYKTITHYNTTGAQDSVDTYGADGALDSRKLYIYTGSNIDTITYTNESGDMTKKEVYHYDGRGILTEVTTYNAAGVATVRTIYKCDGRDNVSRVTVYNVGKKFGAQQNDMVDMVEYTYEYQQSIAREKQDIRDETNWNKAQ